MWTGDNAALFEKGVVLDWAQGILQTRGKFLILGAVGIWGITFGASPYLEKCVIVGSQWQVQFAGPSQGH